MVNEHAHNNPRVQTKEIFSRLSEKFSNIYYNMSLLMASLARNLIPFRELGGSNSEIISEGKLRDNEDLENESWKKPKKRN
jgi:hypothetical protein